MNITKQIAELHPGKVLVVEPNIECVNESERFDLVTQEEAEASADIFLMLVDHKQFKSNKVAPKGLQIDTKGIWK